MSKPVHCKWSWQETQVTMATWWMLCSKKEAREKESRIASYCLVFFIFLLLTWLRLCIRTCGLPFILEMPVSLLRAAWLCGLVFIYVSVVLVILTATGFGLAAEKPQRPFVVTFPSWKPEWAEWTHTHTHTHTHIHTWMHMWTHTNTHTHTHRHKASSALSPIPPQLMQVLENVVIKQSLLGLFSPQNERIKAEDMKGLIGVFWSSHF